MRPAIRQHPSPNFGARRDGLRPELVVIHYTAMETAQAAIDWLCNPEAEVSAHYVICEQGQITQLVAEDMRAWHAGMGEWQGRDDVNSRSIGIELANRGNHPFPAQQMTALEMLLRGIMARWGIGPAGVIGHSDLAPGRKIDPGLRFDWHRLEIQGLAERRGDDHGPPDASMSQFREIAKSRGYTASVDDETLLAAVRLRYRPWARGPLIAEDFTPIGHAALWT
ncbi:N-acetylmuramoyl-L-alanine amidase [Shimia marina]|uniref:N-acetylmuramoyl-L-alanine amidase n=1 Tax=Shimia marina TaxID=321267 RepID=A0A0P1FEA6_9RHOB|nr:N-acetylmuramoyl-L-alanine amidase [Shimia marina]CUH52525.1 1,6-anhydro-N-acetylmuramyl-L-alanine amidase AmpD [Shimia marina]SFE49002.1 N-acetylmuramoyl-L-alanine amidase [Shimia marina]